MMQLLSHNEILGIPPNEVIDIKVLKNVLNNYSDGIDYLKFAISKDRNKEPLIILTIANESNTILDHE
jgi:hypothetical protein